MTENRIAWSGTMTMASGARPVRAARGTELFCLGWQQEAALRMLQNNLAPENAERPDDLEWAPRVLLANSNLVGDWANWEEFRRLEEPGLTMFGQMTAGSWIYIGSQGILQGTYETFAAVAAKRFGGDLAGTITLTGGLGGMGGAQPLAVTMAGGVAICVECNPSWIARRLEHGYLDVQAADLDDALRLATEARDSRRPLSIGLLGNAADVVPQLLAAGAPIDVVTDMGRSIHAGQVRVANGTELADQKLERVLSNDPGMGVIRHVDAGYGRASEVAAGRGVRVPMAGQP